jgi:hypothetical protein
MSGRKRAIQVAVLAFALLAIACAVRAARHDPFGLDARSRYVCVATGELFELSADQAGMVPARSPRTGEWTLLPCAVGDDGRLYVGQRYRPVLTDRLGDANHHVDPQTLAVR